MKQVLIYILMLILAIIRLQQAPEAESVAEFLTCFINSLIDD